MCYDLINSDVRDRFAWLWLCSLKTLRRIRVKHKEAFVRAEFVFLFIWLSAY